jgi:large subunit ribosomal protein L4
MKVDVLNMEGEKARTVDLPAGIFEAPIKIDLMHQALMRQLANARLGTHKTKTRSEVSGGGRKPWRQKGTGRARHGSIRSPIWVGGGKVHTPQPRSYVQRMPRKMRRAALRSALSAKAAQQEIILLEELRMDAPKTRQLNAMLRAIAGEASVLLVLDGPNREVELSARNLPSVKTLRADYLNIRDLLQFERLVMPLGALEMIESHLGG